MICTSILALPSLEDVTPELVFYGDTYITLQFPQIVLPSENPLSKHYYYTVQIKPNSADGNWTIVAGSEIPHSPDITVSYITVETLQPDTSYSFRIVPGRRNPSNLFQQYGTPSHLVILRTDKSATEEMTTEAATTSKQPAEGKSIVMFLILL